MANSPETISSMRSRNGASDPFPVHGLHSWSVGWVMGHGVGSITEVTGPHKHSPNAFFCRLKHCTYYNGHRWINDAISALWNTVYLGWWALIVASWCIFIFGRLLNRIYRINIYMLNVLRCHQSARFNSACRLLYLSVPHVLNMLFWVPIKFSSMFLLPDTCSLLRLWP